jgi:hypothetical protein
MDDRHSEVEGEAEREVTFTPRELEMIAEARAQAAIEGTIPWEEAKAWILSLGTSAERPMPEPRKHV